LHPPPPHPFPTRRSSDLLVGHQDRAPTLGGDRVRAAWPAKAAATPALVRTQDRGVDVAEAIDLQRIQDADIHVPELREVASGVRSEEHTSELQSPDHLVC